MRRLLLAAGACAAMAALVVSSALSAPSGSRPTPAVPAFSGPLVRHDLQRRPYVIAISGDGSDFLAGQGQTSTRPRTGRLSWSQWSATDGRATGANWVDDCLPSCAQGTLHPYRIAIHVYRPRPMAGHRLFTRMTITYTVGRPDYVPHRSLTFSLVYKPTFDKTFFWSQ